MNHLFAGIVCIASLSGLSGCTQHREEIAVKSPESYAAYTQSGGVSVGLEPFDTYLKSTQAFGSNVSREFTPIQMVIETRADEKFVVYRDHTKLVCADGTTLEPVSALAMYEHYRQDTTMAALFGIHVAAAAASDDNDRMRTDLSRKEFPAETIVSPGQRTNGFLYFRGVCSRRSGRTLQVAMENVVAPETLNLTVALRPLEPK